MKLSTRLVATTSALAMILAGPVLAQTTTPAPAEDPAAAQDQEAAPAPLPPDTVITEQEEGQTLSSSLIGQAVLGPEDEEIGEITELVFDQDDRIVAAVISVGGFLGMGSKSVAVPWDKLETSTVDGSSVTIANVTEQQLADAPAFQTLEDIRQAEAAAQQQMQQPTGGTTTTQ